MPNRVLQSKINESIHFQTEAQAQNRLAWKQCFALQLNYLKVVK